jgi:biotin carboxylase
MRVEGIRTTIALHRRILEHPAFQSGAYDVDLLAKGGLLVAS